MEWAEETILRLRALWDEGLSTAEIGRRLGVSKNAVVGKAHRLEHGLGGLGDRVAAQIDRHGRTLQRSAALWRRRRR